MSYEDYNRYQPDPNSNHKLGCMIVFIFTILAWVGIIILLNWIL